MIWQRCPKTVFDGRKKLELAVHDAAIVLNDGESGRLEVFELLKLKTGPYTTRAFNQFDEARPRSHQRHSTPTAKAKRAKKRVALSSAEAGESSYKAGAF